MDDCNKIPICEARIGPDSKIGTKCGDWLIAAIANEIGVVKMANAGLVKQVNCCNEHPYHNCRMELGGNEPRTTGSDGATCQWDIIFIFLILSL